MSYLTEEAVAQAVESEQFSECSVHVNPCHRLGSKRVDEAPYVLLFPHKSDHFAARWGYCEAEEEAHRLKALFYKLLKGKEVK